MIVGLLLEAAVMGSMASLILNVDQHRTKWSRHLSFLIGYLSTYKVPKEVSKRVIQFYSYLWQCRSHSKSRWSLSYEQLLRSGVGLQIGHCHHMAGQQTIHFGRPSHA